MITGELKNKIDSIWEIFWTGGLTNPLDVIEQMTYMMFIHDLDGETDRKRTEQSFFVPKQEIVDNDYDLSINKYKETEYVPVEYPPTEEIMAELRELEMKIGEEMEELERLLKRRIIDEHNDGSGIVS